MIPVLKRMLQMIIPQTCAVCENPLNEKENSICTQCLINLPKTKMELHHNILIDKLMGRIPIAQAHSLCYIEKDNIVENILYQIKYKNAKDLALEMGILWAEELKQKNLSASCIIPIPLSKQKLYKRGFNQTERIAQGMEKVLKIPIYKPLIRIKNTDSQTKKNRIERAKNMESAFTIDQKTNYKIENPLIIDDIITTGATMESYCQTLLKYYPECKLNIGSIAVKL